MGHPAAGGRPARFLRLVRRPHRLPQRGGWRESVARPAACGLTREPPVFTAAGHDTASAVAAVPAEGGSGWCYISSGTWSLMGMELQRPLINAASLEADFTTALGGCGSIRFLKNIPGLWLLQE